MPVKIEHDMAGNRYEVHYQPRDVAEWVQDMSYANARMNQRAMAQTSNNLVWAFFIGLRILRYWLRIIFAGSIGERIGFAVGAALSLLAIVPGIISHEYSAAYGILLILTGFLAFATPLAFIGGLINRVVAWFI
jgi:hypothetical protein